MQGEWSGELVGPDVWASRRELIPPGSVFAFLAEHRAVLFPAGMFADMYPSANGRPSMPPQILAAVVTLQALNGLSDFETVQELRCDLRWKAGCGLGLYDTAFDPSLLSYFRRRLSRSTDPQRIFTAVRAVVRETGILKGRVRRALDSTVLDDAVATQDTVTQLIACVRRVARVVPGAADVVAVTCTGLDYADPGKPRIAWNDDAARADLVDALVSDAIRLLAALPEREHGPEASDAPGLLALVAGQDVEPAEDSDGRDGRWRITQGTAPDRIVSTVDPEACHVPRPAPTSRTGTRRTWRWSRRPGSTPRSPYAPGPGPGTTRPPSPWTCWTRTSRPPAYKCTATPRTAAGTRSPRCWPAATASSSSPHRSTPRSRAVLASTTS